MTTFIRPTEEFLWGLRLWLTVVNKIQEVVKTPLKDKFLQHNDYDQKTCNTNNDMSAMHNKDWFTLIKKNSRLRFLKAAIQHPI